MRFLFDSGWIRDLNITLYEIFKYKIYHDIIRTRIANTKMVVVAHSFGCFYAIHLCEIYHNMFTKLLLIEPVAKTDKYRLKLVDAMVNPGPDSVEFYKVNNFDLLPTGLNLENKIIVRIHLNLDTKNLEDNMFIDRVSYFNKLTNANIKSRLMVHVNVSHMIHYKKPDMIIDSIKELVKI